MSSKALIIKNKKAHFEYHVDFEVTAGLQLKGTEVKSIREHNVNINDSYCLVEAEELWIKNMHIGPFKQASFNQHEPLRSRKLLITKRELRKIHSKVKEKGTAIFPIQLFESERGLIKLKIGIGKGKKSYDKRNDLKTKDIQRELSKIGL